MPGYDARGRAHNGQDGSREDAVLVAADVRRMLAQEIRTKTSPSLIARTEPLGRIG